MNQADDALAKNIVRLLDEGADRLGPAVRERLLAARKEALGRYREQPVRAWDLVAVGNATARYLEDHPNARFLIAGAALLVALAGVAYWPGMNGTGELAEIDVGLLTGDLPIDAYLDKGFDSWLKRSLR
jgi:hypothetical protein